MEQDNDVQKKLDEVMDWLSDQPEEFIRRIFSDRRLPREVDFRWTIGGTEYTVISHFKSGNAEAVIDKVRRLMESGAKI